MMMQRPPAPLLSVPLPAAADRDQRLAAVLDELLLHEVDEQDEPGQSPASQQLLTAHEPGLQTGGPRTNANAH